MLILDPVHGLFEGYTFSFYGSFTSSLSLSNLQQIVTTGHATVLPDLPQFPSHTDQFIQKSNKIIVICDPENTTADVSSEIQAKCSFLPVGFAWILDCISAYEVLSVDKYRVLPNKPSTFLETQQSLEF